MRSGPGYPLQRPTANEWLHGLVRTWDMAAPCGNAHCPAKWMVVHDVKQVRCPFCKTKPATPIPVLKFRSEGRPGNWLSDGQLVIYPNLTLFKWHAFSKLFPGPEVDRTPQAYCAWHQGQWLLVNQNLPSLTSPSGNHVPPGQAVVLTPGPPFRLSREPNGRMVEVELVRP